MVKVRSNYFNTVAAIVAAITVATALNADAVEGAGVEDYNGEISDADIQQFMDFMADYYPPQHHEVRKRARFCLRRDMTCPKLKNGKDFCCDGSQCSCNLFNQNCKCSTIGLFQRFG